MLVITEPPYLLANKTFSWSIYHLSWMHSCRLIYDCKPPQPFQNGLITVELLIASRKEMLGKMAQDKL